MKRFLWYFLLFLGLSTILLLSKMDFTKQEVLTKKIEQEEKVQKFAGEKRAVFFSYIELSRYILDKSEEEAKQNIITVLENMNDNYLNMLLLQVRSFSDAIYPSNLFPSSRMVVHQEGDAFPFDILSFFISEAHKRNIEVHAWINPYRIRNSVDMENISSTNPAQASLQNGSAKIIEGKGIFYNPAREEVKQLILNGIQELLETYPVDGIHFDDYFYPDLTIDEAEYQEALKTDATLSHDAFRLSQVSDLIKRVYTLVKSKNKNLLFGISPEGNIENNYTSNFVDSKRFLKEEGFVDYIMPQIYFGFENERKPFLDTVKEWNDLITLDTVTLLPALAFYKVGRVDTYALSGKDEWILSGGDMIKKEVIASRNLSHYQGFSLFRYDSIFASDKEVESVVKEEQENLKETLQPF